MLSRRLSAIVAAVVLGVSVVAAQAPGAEAAGAVRQAGSSGKVKVLGDGSAYYYHYSAAVSLCLGDRYSSNPAIVTQAKAYIGSATALGPRWLIADGDQGSTVSMYSDTPSSLTYGWACLGFQ